MPRFAPDFELQDQNGGLFRLSSMRGRHVLRRDLLPLISSYRIRTVDSLDYLA
jgi:hypothetical protein